jgi:uncharacterized protein YdaU (DUF1376 family)
MNYFEFYPGDYLRDTMRLTLAEHGAYLRLLMAYYSDEQPLPAENDALFRIVSAQNSAEKSAVLKVADLFFPVTRDGVRRNARADTEIAKAQGRMDTKGELKSTEAKRQQRYRDRRADMFTALARIGIVPKYNIATDELTSLVTQNVTSQTVTNVTPSRPSHTATRPQTPYTNQEQEQEQEQDHKLSVKSPKNVTAPKPPSRFEEFWAIYPRKVSRAAAKKAFDKLAPNDELLVVMLKAVGTQAKSEQWAKDPQFIPYPATWLNGKRWEDEQDGQVHFALRSHDLPDYLVGAI